MVTVHFYRSSPVLILIAGIAGCLLGRYVGLQKDTIFSIGAELAGPVIAVAIVNLLVHHPGTGTLCRAVTAASALTGTFSIWPGFARTNHDVVMMMAIIPAILCGLLHPLVSIAGLARDD